MARINIQIEGMSIEEAKVVMKAIVEATHDAETSAAPEEVAVKVPAEDDLPGDLGQGGKGPPKSPKQETKSEAKPSKPAKAKGKLTQKKDTNVVDLDEKRAGTVVEKLAKFTKLVDVIEVLRESGFSEDDALIAECERIKDQVPVLKKIPDITGRVKRVLERLSA